MGSFRSKMTLLVQSARDSVAKQRCAGLCITLLNALLLLVFLACIAPAWRSKPQGLEASLNSIVNQIEPGSTQIALGLDREDMRLGEASEKEDASLTNVEASADLGHETREHVFTSIYQGNQWGSAESRSGAGSEMWYTGNIRKFMGLAMRVYRMKSLLDAPCGDCNWQPSIPGFDGIQYTGVDIVKDVIEANKAKYRTKGNMRFFHVDLASDAVPDGEYDAVLCRDMVQHLPLSAGVGAYRALENSGAKYLFTSFHSEATENTESGFFIGGQLYVDPMRPPFNFTKPLMYAVDGLDWTRPGLKKQNYKMIGLWRLPALHRGDGLSSIAPVDAASIGGNIVILDPSVPVMSNGSSLNQELS